MIAHPRYRAVLSVIFGAPWTALAIVLFEWWAAEMCGGDLGVACLGTQGDVWEAQRDGALAARAACQPRQTYAPCAGATPRPSAA